MFRAIDVPVRVACVALVALLTPPALAQMTEVPLSQRIDEAKIIVEGQVLESTPFFNPQGTLIHTAHRIQVYKMFKGLTRTDSALTEIALITRGGQIDGRLHVVTPSLQLKPGDSGVFFIEQRSRHAGRVDALLPFAGPQGFVRYRSHDGSAVDPFRHYRDVTRDVHEAIQKRTGQVPRTVAPFDRGTPTSASVLGAHTITGFTPSVVRAGIQESVTIHGSGFGTHSGSAAVFFDDSDDGVGGSFGNADAEHIVSWNDSAIVVLVPNRLSGVNAGTGKVLVRNSAGADVFSDDDLTVQYALNEVLSGGALYRVSQVDLNMRGGYTFRPSTSTAGNGVDFTTVTEAVARFEEAVSEWSCAVGWSADVDGTTSIQAPGDDGVNIVAFDNDADPLGGGTSGRASSFYSSCLGDTWRLDGVDIRFKRDGTGGLTWYYGAHPAGQTGSETDFKSVALHEVGHTVQHSHINDAADPMHYSLTTGTSSRTLSVADLAGGDETVDYSAAYDSCSLTGMQAFDCTVAPTANFTVDALGVCGSSLAVEFTDLSTNGPTSWDWSFGDTGSSSLRNPSHTYTSTGLFGVSLTATNGVGSDGLTRDNYIVVTSDPEPADCDPTFAGYNDCCSIGVRNVTLNSIDNSTDTVTQGDPFHEDFTCSQFTVLESGASYPISVTTGSFNDEHVRAYIDWNDDGDLTGGELVLISGPGPAGSHSGTVNVPASAVKDTALRMRIVSDFGAAAGACDNLEFGQVEDYSVLVVDAAAAQPGAVPDDSLTVAKNAALGDLDFDWTISCGPGATDYSLHQGTIGSWYSHTSLACTTGGATELNGVTPDSGSSYYLVVPLSGSAEGSYGTDSTAAERPVSSSVCRASQDFTTCP